VRHGGSVISTAVLIPMLLIQKGRDVFWSALWLYRRQKTIGVPLSKALSHYEKKAQQLCALMEDNIDEGLTIFAFLLAHHKGLRTSHLAERVNWEV
jgi:transposase-like protein